MQRFSTWMVVSLDVVFWLLRIIATYTYAMGIEFMIKPINMNMEITMIFIALLAFILIVKRKFLGTVIYMIGYIGYFGVALLNNIQKMVTVGRMPTDYINVLFYLIGVVLSLFTFLDLLLDKGRQVCPKDQKTDWFYGNKKYDMQKDKRDDKNNYRTL